MGIGKRNKTNFNTSEGRKIYTITSQTTREELMAMKKEIRIAIKNIRSVKPNDKNILNQLPSIAHQILQIYDSSENHDILIDILDTIANYIIESNNGHKLDDLDDLGKKSNVNIELLHSIHARTLFEGNKPIPKNLSVSYLNELFTTTGKSTPTNFIYDEQILNFIENLGHEFRITNKETYLEIVREIVYDPIKLDEHLSQDPKITQDSRILNILINYARTYKDLCDEKGEDGNWQIGEIINIIQTRFAELISSFSEEKWNALKKKIEDCFSGFAFQLLTKDITAYSSFQEFIDEINKQLVNPTAPLPHVSQPRIIINSRSDPKGMSDDAKFISIQNLVKHLRKQSPNLVIPTVLVGYREPFEGYIVFPFEKNNDRTLEENTNTYNIIVSDTFGLSKSGSFRAMTKSNITRVLGSDRNSMGPQISGAATRTDSYSIPGVIAVTHVQNQTYYEGMIQEAVEELMVNPQIQFSYSLRKKISEMRQSQTKTGPKTSGTPSSPTSSVPQNPTHQPNPVVQPTSPTPFVTKGADQYGYDALGINLEEVRRSVLYSSQNGENILAARERITESLFHQYGYNRNPGLNLLDHFLKEMLISGKTMIDIVNDLLSREEYKEFVDYFNQHDNSPQKDTAFRKMYSYVKNMIFVAVENDPDYPNEKMKELYERELQRLDSQSISLDQAIQDKRTKRNELVQNTKRALEYFNTTYEAEK